MHALVTGITGFVGGYLAEHLVAQGVQVSGMSRSGVWPASLQHLSDQVRLVQCDLSDPEAVSRFFAEHSFRWIFHLAGLANPRQCVDNPVLSYAANVQSIENLLASCNSGARVLYVSTSYVYGKPGPTPIDESCSVQPNHPYAESKWMGEQVCQSWCEKGRIVVRVRPFNHTGPRQPLGYVVPDWIEQIVRMEQDKIIPRLRVGNLDSRRDFTDVRDIVRAYTDLIKVGESGMVYNLGTGRALSGAEILEELAALSSVRFEIESDPSRIRSGEADTIVANPKLIQELTGWTPQISFHQTLADSLTFWRQQC